MGRDFRPKGKGGASRPRPQPADSDADEVSDQELLRQVQSLGGNEDDVALMRSQGGGSQLSVRAQFSRRPPSFPRNSQSS